MPLALLIILMLPASLGFAADPPSEGVAAPPFGTAVKSDEPFARRLYVESIGVDVVLWNETVSPEKQPAQQLMTSFSNDMNTLIDELLQCPASTSPARRKSILPCAHPLRKDGHNKKRPLIPPPTDHQTP